MRNYLAIAGKSYYHSEAFEREGLNVDPISRFGIGILSCFMVADELHIETFRDPYMPGDAQPLRIRIPAPKKQFRIETPVETASPGTTVKVFVKGEKLPRVGDEEGGKEAGKPKPLDVTKYLSIVAGFVEFPIVITEGDRKTIVLHPYQDAEAAGSLLYLPLDQLMRGGTRTGPESEGNRASDSAMQQLETDRNGNPNDPRNRRTRQ
ncbi:MAG: hypothetical protein IH912_08860 [Proteobacteria bacterium]|nr:hypothetical protein [Pseudomonadota bacterium]